MGNANSNLLENLVQGSNCPPFLLLEAKTQLTRPKSIGMSSTDCANAL